MVAGIPILSLVAKMDSAADASEISAFEIVASWPQLYLMWQNQNFDVKTLSKWDIFGLLLFILSLQQREILLIMFYDLIPRPPEDGLYRGDERKERRGRPGRGRHYHAGGGRRGVG